MSDEKKTRETKTPAQKLSDLRSMRAGALLRRQEVDANIGTIDARIARLMHANPELAAEAESAEV